MYLDVLLEFALMLVCGVMSVSALEWSPSTGIQRFRRHTTDGGVCVLPGPLQNGRYKPSYRRCPPENQTPACQLTPGAYVPPYWVLHFTCDDGYVLNQNLTVAACVNGRWHPELPACNRPKLCPPLRNFGVEITCSSGGYNVSCTESVIPGTVAALKCKDGYQLPYLSEPSQLTCLDSGTWDYPAFYCTPGEALHQQGDALVSHTPHHNIATISLKPEPEVRISVQKCRDYMKAVYKSQEKGGEVATCGIPNVTDAQSHGYPYLAEFRVKFPNMASGWSCLGSLISERFVLSALDCSLGSTANQVRLGYYARNSIHYDGSSTTRQDVYDISETISTRERPGPPFNYNNIALYKLSENVKFDEFVRPICLQTLADTYATATVLRVIAEPNSIQKLNATVVERDKCISYYQNEQGESFKLINSLLCVEMKPDSSCEVKWDGGAPLVTRLEKPDCMYSLVGVLSRGYICKDVPTNVFTSVSHFLPWIESVVWP